MSNRKSPELKLFPAMFKYECLVRLLAYVFMAVWYHYGIVMNVCWIMGDSAGDTNGLEFCNCHAAVREGWKLMYSPSLRSNTSVTPLLSSVGASSVGSERRGGRRRLCVTGQVWNHQSGHGAAWRGCGSALIWTENYVVQTLKKIFFPFLFWMPTWNELTYYLVFILWVSMWLCRAQRWCEERGLVLSLVSVSKHWAPAPSRCTGTSGALCCPVCSWDSQSPGTLLASDS